MTETDQSALARWTHQRIHAECAQAYAKYIAAVRTRHIAYYGARPDERSSTHAFAARDRAVAFPPDMEHLADLDLKWHRHHLSGGSSQILAVALLTSALERDPEAAWLLEDALGAPVDWRFEYELSPDTLSERPRVTSIDWLLSGRSGLACVEAKFTETGLGTCSCSSRASGECSPRVLERPYWGVARMHFGLDGPYPPKPCELSVTYQAVRNGAAALALAGPNRAAFLGLLYDEGNPYFTGARAWPGWISILSGVLEGESGLRFAARSWQELLHLVDLSDDIREWAMEKHGLQ